MVFPWWGLIKPLFLGGMFGEGWLISYNNTTNLKNKKPAVASVWDALWLVVCQDLSSSKLTNAVYTKYVRCMCTMYVEFDLCIKKLYIYFQYHVYYCIFVDTIDHCTHCTVLNCCICQAASIPGHSLLGFPSIWFSWYGLLEWTLTNSIIIIIIIIINPQTKPEKI